MLKVKWENRRGKLRTSFCTQINAENNLSIPKEKDLSIYHLLVIYSLSSTYEFLTLSYLLNYFFVI